MEVDTTGWPIVVKRVGAKIGTTEMNAYLAALRTLFDRRQPFACVVIVKQRGTLDFATIKQYGAFVNEHQTDMRSYYRGAAFVFPGEAFRLLLSSLLAVTPKAVPYKVFADQQTAYDWAAEQVRAAGAIPPMKQPVLWP